MIRWGVAALLAVLALVAACGSGGQDRPAGGGTLQQRLDQAGQGLCEAASLARQGRVDRAGAVFNDRSHQFLHDLAPQVQQEDPAAAAGLLEAKNRVETALRDAGRGDATPEQVADLLSALAAALGRAAEVLGARAPACDGAA